MRPKALHVGYILYWTIRTYDPDKPGVLKDADSTPSVAVRKNGSSTGDSVTVTKRSATTGLYDAFYNPSGEAESDTFELEETATITGTTSSSATYSSSFNVKMLAVERGTDSAVPATVFTGMTSLADWLRRVIRKDAGTAGMATAAGEISTGGTSSWTAVTDNLEAIYDLGGGSGLDAAGVRAAIGLSAANLDTQLSTIASYIDTEVAQLVALLDTEIAAIQAKTDLIPASPASEATLSALSAKLAGITLLKNWLALIMGKAADTTTRAEVNATTAGATFNETTDSLEAARDGAIATSVISALSSGTEVFGHSYLESIKRVEVASGAATLSGAGTGTEVMTSSDGSKTATFTVDGSGNISSVVWT